MIAAMRITSGSRGQSSLEALLASAALISALAVLALASQNISSKTAVSIEKAAELHTLSYAAFLVDESAQSLSGAVLRSHSGANASLHQHAICSRRNPAVCQPVFHSLYYDSNGDIYVQNSQAAPV